MKNQPRSCVVFHGIKKLFLPILIAYVVSLSVNAWAGGGGENLLLVVNPNDEPSLRIANAYIAARHIPPCNVLYLVPPLAAKPGFTLLTISENSASTGYDAIYRDPINNAIASRGLINQIDYIGTLGQTHVVSSTNADYGFLSLHDCLNQLTQFKSGMAVADVYYRPSELLQTPNLINSYKFDYTPGTNTAIHHSQALTNLSNLNGSETYVSGTLQPTTVQWYMTGMIGYTGHLGMNPEQVIQSLRRSAAADGTKPPGTIYFELNKDIRSTTRMNFWPPVQSYMSAHGMPWIQVGDTNSYSYITPVNCPNVLGAEIGDSIYQAPLGSSYAPGSWSDCLTSYGGWYATSSQTQANMLLQAGCAASAGTVTEPGADQRRFPLCDIWVFQHDGSTLGEAYYKSVDRPDLLMFQGDLLSQAYADIPQVTFTSAPANGSTVSGNISISSSASLSNPLTATGIASLSLFLDGTNTGMSVSSASGAFNLNTTTLTDGMHEFRVVAYNNSSAASEGCGLLNLQVNNLGQSVSIAGGTNYTITWNQSLPLSVSATKGSGLSINSIQLQSYGRLLGSLSASSGTITLSGTQLAFDANVITPVAILSNSNQVLGTPITVTRQFRQLPGSKPTPVVNQYPGFDFYYYTYPGAAGNTLATANFSGTAAYVGHADAASILSADALNPNLPSALRGTSGNLAVAIKGLFTVTTPGEYGFSFTCYDWTSAGILVDGVLLNYYDRWTGTSFTGYSGTYISPYTWDTGATVYLLPGEHSVTAQLVQMPARTSGTTNCFTLYYRGLQTQVPTNGISNGRPNGIPSEMMQIATSPTFYTARKTNGH